MFFKIMNTDAKVLASRILNWNCESFVKQSIWGHRLMI